jgi:hypothetical protein
MSALGTAASLAGGLFVGGVFALCGGLFVGREAVQVREEDEEDGPG